MKKRQRASRKSRRIREKTNRKTGKSGEISIWLIAVSIILAISFLSSLYLLAQKVIAILFLNIKFGVYISAILLLIYSALLFLGILNIFLKKRKAIKITVYALYIGIAFTLWYWLIGQLIFYKQIPFIITNAANLIVNLAIIILILLYFKKSMKLRGILTGYNAE